MVADQPTRARDFEQGPEKIDFARPPRRSKKRILDDVSRLVAKLDRRRTPRGLMHISRFDRQAPIYKLPRCQRLDPATADLY
jgi:hypothetical protein